MDFSKLSQNDKWAVYGSVAAFLGGVVSNWGGLFWLAVVASVAMVAVVLQPQLMKGTSLPGSKGSLMAALGIGSLAAGVIEMLRFINYFLNTLGRFSTLAFIVALVGAAVMAWAGWNELKAEGGTWRFGSAAPASGSSSAPSAPAAPTSDTEPPAPPPPA
jgi:hypothetical protein